MGVAGNRGHLLRGVGQRLDEQSHRLRDRDGAVTDVNPWRAMFNDGVWLQFLHMWLAAFMVVGLVVSGVYAAGLLRGRTDAHHRLGFTVPFVFGTVAAVAQPLVGHVLGMRIARHPAGKAGRVRTRRDDRGPSAVSAGRRADRRRGAVGVGDPATRLDHRPQLVRHARARSGHGARAGLAAGQRHPPGLPVDGGHRHAAGSGRRPVLAARAGAVEICWTTVGSFAFRSSAGPLAILAMELGWVATEVGRQPWTVWQILRTTDAASMTTGLWWSYTAVLVIYLGMTVGACIVLRSMARRWRAGETDLPSPYGPPQEEPVP